MAEQAELTRTGHQNRLQTINPATAEPGRSYEAHNLDDAHRAAAAARKAFLDWRRTSFGERAAIVRKAAGILRNRQEDFARLMTGATELKTSQFADAMISHM